MNLINRIWPRRSAALPRPVILLYHRVAELTRDPWELAVDPEKFEQQLRWLREQRHVMPLHTFVSLNRERRIPSDAVAITFDDGYACNATVAMPLLSSYEMPATFFLTTAAIGSEREFWWDELERICFSAKGRITFYLGNELLSFDFGKCFEVIDSARGWRALGHSRTPRQAAYLALWEKLIHVDDGLQARVLRHLGDHFRLDDTMRESYRPMNVTEVKTLVGNGLFDLGAHTLTHPDLTKTRGSRKIEEIRGSRDACKAISGKPVPGFSYPYGRSDARTRSVVESSTFDYACSSDCAAVRPEIDVMMIPRVPVPNVTGAEFAKFLRRIA